MLSLLINLQSRATHPTSLQHMSAQSAAVFPKDEVISVLMNPCVGLAADNTDTLSAVPTKLPFSVLHVRDMMSPAEAVVVATVVVTAGTVVVGVVGAALISVVGATVGALVGAMVLGKVGITVLATVVTMVVGVVTAVVGVVAAVVVATVVVAIVLSPSHPFRYWSKTSVPVTTLPPLIR